MPVLPFLIAALCVMAIAYRYYSAFIAAKVLLLDPNVQTPAHTYNDGHNYFPTHRWVLFGHHFAAISGAGPLIGPVLAAQFGFLPGYLWLLIGVVIGGAVHDFVILTASIRHQGRSVAVIAREVISPLAGKITSLAILFIVIVALAGLGLAVVNALSESAWGIFTVGMTVPLAFVMGLYIYKLRGGTVLAIKQASLFGVLGLLLFLALGKVVADSAWAASLHLSRNQITVAIAAYGFIASVLPVWLLLCPRDYLSSYMKLGTVLLLVVAVFLVQPELKMPAVSLWADGGGPIVSGKLFPFVFITIACGAISGFHSLVASGTTPKMIKQETDARMIGYGAMLIEGLVGIIALIAACALQPEDYFAINVSPEKFQELGMSPVHLAEIESQVGERVSHRPGGAVSLAVGMAQIFTGLPFMQNLMSYWYHFAIMFEALFILTTIDTGTRVGRFLLQEALGLKTNQLWGSILTSALIVIAWSYFILTGSISTIWPMFGIGNQLLATVALAIASSYIVKIGKIRYVWVTLIPMLFVGVITLIAGYQSVKDNFLRNGAYLMAFLTIAMMIMVIIIWLEALLRTRKYLK